MKVRTGFVSNSSSSSFVITAKEPLNRDNLLALFKVPTESPLYCFTMDLADWFVENSEQITVKKYVEEHCYDSDDELPPILMDAIANKKLIYVGSASDDAYGEIEATICGMSINHISAEFSIEKDGNY